MENSPVLIDTTIASFETWDISKVFNHHVPARSANRVLQLNISNNSSEDDEEEETTGASSPPESTSHLMRKSGIVEKLTKDASTSTATSIAAVEKTIEPLLVPNKDRFVLFPINSIEIWEMYKKAVACFWTTEEIDLSQDVNDWNKKLNEDERFFVSHVLAFFSSSDGIVNENLATRFMSEVQIPEARYSFTKNFNCM